VTRKVASETLARTVIRGVTVPCSVMGARRRSAFIAGVNE